MRILLTGATGFVGRAVCHSAVHRGHEVLALVRSSEAAAALGRSPGVVTALGSLGDPAWSDIERFAPDACLHCAWIATPGVYLESVENQALLDASRAFLRGVLERGVGAVVSLGSCAEYGYTGRPLREEDSTVSGSAYARCKNELRLWLGQESAARQVPLCWARIFYPYGPGEHPARFPSWVIQRLLRGEPVAPRTPDSVKDYIHVADLAEALCQLLEARASGVVNIGSGEGVTVQSLAGMLGRLMNRESLIQAPEQVQTDPFPHHLADITRLRSFGWAPRITLEEGLRNLVDTWRA